MLADHRADPGGEPAQAGLPGELCRLGLRGGVAIVGGGAAIETCLSLSRLDTCTPPLAGRFGPAGAGATGAVGTGPKWLVSSEETRVGKGLNNQHRNPTMLVTSPLLVVS